MEPDQLSANHSRIVSQHDDPIQEMHVTIKHLNQSIHAQTDQNELG